MHRSNGRVIFSASDLVGFLECEHFTSLALINLEMPLPRAEDDAAAVLLQEKGHDHESRYLERLQIAHAQVTDLSALSGDVSNRIAYTLEEMKAGAEVIYQGALGIGDFIGYPDFLRRVDKPSDLGSFSYEVVDTKLARSVRTKFVVQLAFYSDCLAHGQGISPAMMHLVLGDQREVSLRFADYARYVAQLRRRFEERIQAGSQSTYPDPCDYCDQCKWRHLCEERRLADDHLCQVANITRIQMGKLQGAGIHTLAALGSLDPKLRIPRISPETLGRIRNQARLQLETRTSGSRKVELLEADDDGRGFTRLPRPSPYDLFFDMEGDPYEDNGLEYLFGIYYFEDGQPRFRAFWAHSRTEERRAFEGFMDFATGRLAQHPEAHIYHYAHYEPTALQRLMCLHGTREAELDNLLRRRKFIDLYKVVREAIRVSEPRYSIKNIEHFYLEERTAEVTDAGASIVYYEQWKETGDSQLLKAIEDYNLDDVRSTYQLREWLLSLRPAHTTWAGDGIADGEETVQPGELTDAEKRIIPYRQALLESLPEDRAWWGPDEEERELTFYLLDFHRRADKPAWWAMFKRMEMSHAELLEDAECLGDLRLIGAPVPDKRSLIWTFEYPEQETKLRTGAKATLTTTREDLGEIEVEEGVHRVRIRRGAKREALPDRISIGPGQPFGAKDIVNAVFRFADSIVARAGRYKAAEAFLRRDLPSFRGIAAGAPILPRGEVTSDGIADVIAQLDGSYLFLQGPPGAGKTYHGSHAIVALLQRGFRVGVSSNSHKAINNLLLEIEKVAHAQSFALRGAKKSSRNDED
jgi:predicted RecB family nuclease